jgi:hypothetical protein
MNEDQKVELDNLDRANFGKLFDSSKYVSIDLSSESVIIEDVWGSSGAYDLTTSDLSRAIHNNQGNTKKYLIAIKQVLL